MADAIETAAGRPAADPAPAKDRTAELDAIIDKWHSESFRGTAVGRDAEIWNLVFHAKEDLKQRLSAFIKEA